MEEHLQQLNGPQSLSWWKGGVQDFNLNQGVIKPEEEDEIKGECFVLNSMLL